ncbi:MAG TPA: glutamate ABC transporter substrate-binding protein [Pseudonocardiaceae bacterium]|nr:glutamate ABC transporter substrate-binding protein [Pseudonocardiaceae bacterium]
MFAAVLAVTAGCGGSSDQEANRVELTPRTPAGARTLTETPPQPGQDTSCDPTKSLRPAGALPPPGQMPDGSTMARIQQRGYLIAGVDQNTYLFGYRNPFSGELSGFDVDIARQLALAIFGDAQKIQFRILTSAQRIPALKAGDVDVVVRTFTINCERRKEVEFSAVYFESSQRILVHRGSTVTGLADLAGRKVCAAKDSTSINRIANAQPRPIPIEVANWSDCLVLFQLGQVDAISTDDTILAGMAEQDPYAKIVAGAALGAEPYGIGVPIANQDMVRFVNGVLERIVSDGTWTRIYQRHLAVLGPPPRPPVPEYRNEP